MQEAKIMVKLDHPCIVKLIGVSMGPPVMLVSRTFFRWLVICIVPGMSPPRVVMGVKTLKW